MYAAYARLVGNPRTTAVKGGTALHRQLAALTRRFGWKDVALVDIDGLRFAVDVLDLRMTAAFSEITAASRDMEILAACLSPGDTFLDIGANHGSYAVRLASRVGATGQVLAFEPQPRLAALVRMSFAANHFAHGVVIGDACGDVERDLSFYVPASHSGTGSLYRDFLGGQSYTTLAVRQRPLDHVMAAYPVTGRVAIKLDVEGAEVNVLRGGREFLRAHRPTLLLEVNTDSLHAAGETPASLVAALLDAGYVAYAESETWPATHPLSALPPEPQRNIVVT
jgi:FkbM family methyltransferase